MAPPPAPGSGTVAGGSSGNLHACIDDSRSMGQHLASRLLQIGCDTVFAVPGDYNLIREWMGFGGDGMRGRGVAARVCGRRGWKGSMVA